MTSFGRQEAGDGGGKGSGVNSDSIRGPFLSEIEEGLGCCLTTLLVLNDWRRLGELKARIR